MNYTDLQLEKIFSRRKTNGRSKAIAAAHAECSTTLTYILEECSGTPKKDHEGLGEVLITFAKAINENCSDGPAVQAIEHLSSAQILLDEVMVSLNSIDDEIYHWYMGAVDSELMQARTKACKAALRE